MQSSILEHSASCYVDALAQPMPARLQKTSVRQMITRWIVKHNADCKLSVFSNELNLEWVEIGCSLDCKWNGLALDVSTRWARSAQVFETRQLAAMSSVEKERKQFFHGIYWRTEYSGILNNIIGGDSTFLSIPVNRDNCWGSWWLSWQQLASWLHRDTESSDFGFWGEINLSYSTPICWVYPSINWNLSSTYCISNLFRTINCRVKSINTTSSRSKTSVARG